MKEKLNTKQGISLIVLVITIIVIIILAVAVILTLANNNPIESARRAVDDNNEATLKEEATLLYADWYMKKNISKENVGEAEKYIKDNLKGNYSEELKNRLQISANGKITIGAPLEKIEEVVIPNGFVHVEGTTVANGFVIKNKTDGNEFVWVPVEKGSFKREGFGIDISAYFEPYKEEGYTSEKEEHDAMLASVEKYGGFYMGRYEASKKTVDGVDIAQSIANVDPWVDIAWCDTGMTGIGENGAVAKARNVYPDSNEKTTGDAVSTLPYGVQWDATVRWIKDSKEEYKNITSDSSTFGNYSSEGTIPTGSEPSYALNNIYDMAGNLNEWTMEAHTGEVRSFRGGHYGDAGNNIPVSSRFYYGPDLPGGYIDMGFRLALYIKV